jgi:hypothetical protein
MAMTPEEEEAERLRKQQGGAESSVDTLPPPPSATSQPTVPAPGALPPPPVVPTAPASNFTTVQTPEGATYNVPGPPPPPPPVSNATASGIEAHGGTVRPPPAPYVPGSLNPALTAGSGYGVAREEKPGESEAVDAARAEAGLPPLNPQFIEPDAAGAGGGGAGAIANDIKEQIAIDARAAQVPDAAPVALTAGNYEIPDIQRKTEIPKVETHTAEGVTVNPAHTIADKVPETEYAGDTQVRQVSGESEWQDLQREAAGYIRDAMAGKTLSPAAMEAQAKFDRAQAQQKSLAAGARGRSVASANRIAADKTAELAGQSAIEIAKIKAAEAAEARKEAAALGTTAHGQAVDVQKTNVNVGTTVDLANDDRYQGVLTHRSDIKAKALAGDQDAINQLNIQEGQWAQDLAKFNATQLQNASAQDVENYLKGVGLDDAFVSKMRDQWLEAQELGQKDRLAKLASDTQIAIANLQKEQGSGFWDNLMKILPALGPIGQGAAALLTAMDDKKQAPAAPANPGSDKRMKTNIVKLEGPELDEFLKATRGAFEWDYKEPEKEGRGAGKYHGPMANDLAKSALGRTAISRDEEGMMRLDLRRLAAMALSGLGRLDERMAKVEGKKKGKA